MLQYGTNVAAGVTPGKGGVTVEGVRVHDTVREAVEKTGSRSSVIFVPAPFFLSAAQEAIGAGIRLLVAITEHVPIRDTLRLIALAESRGASIVGPNTPGMIVPHRRLRLGIMPASAFREGKVALFSRSGTLMYEVANQLSTQGFGQKIAVGIGGDPVNCTTLMQWFDQAMEMDDVDAIVVVGEIGGDAEEMLAKHIEKTGGLERKPVFAYIAGRSAPKERAHGPRRGHNLRRIWNCPLQDSGAWKSRRQGSDDSNTDTCHAEGLSRRARIVLNSNATFPDLVVLHKPVWSRSLGTSRL